MLRSVKEKNLSLRVLNLVTLVLSKFLEVDLRDLDGTYNLIKSERYWGAIPFKH